MSAVKSCFSKGIGPEVLLGHQLGLQNGDWLPGIGVTEPSASGVSCEVIDIENGAHVISWMFQQTISGINYSAFLLSNNMYAYYGSPNRAATKIELKFNTDSDLAGLWGY